MQVELSYLNSNAISGISFSVSEQTRFLIEGEDYRQTEDQFSFSAYSTGPFDFNPNLSRSNNSALEILNDSRVVSSHDDESNPEAVRERQEVRAVMYDVLGRRIRTVLEDRELSPHDIHPIGVQAECLSSGVYFLRIQGENSLRSAGLPSSDNPFFRR